jgi:putative DNA primase/helicase
MRPDALTVAAIDAGNLLPVAEVMRRVSTGANYHRRRQRPPPKRTSHRQEAAEKAALSVAGWVSMPPTDYKADWNDHHQQNGLEAATAAFNDSMYQPQGKM